MNNWFYVTIMSVVQGITEFLPVSSSGHLAVLSELFGISEDRSMALGIVLHAGSLLAIVAFYYKVLLGFCSKSRIHLALMVILASVPAGLAGVGLKLSGMGESMFGNLFAIGICFAITANLLRLSERSKLIFFRGKSTATPPTELDRISVRQALTVGVVQMFAILPGISRSGSTISAGILSNIQREAAATFSFLLAIVAIGGAAFLELLSMLRKGTATAAAGDVTLIQIIFGFLLTAAVSFGALSFLMKLIRKGKLSYFSWYLYILAAAVIIWQLTAKN